MYGIEVPIAFPFPLLLLLLAVVDMNVREQDLIGNDFFEIPSREL